MESCQREGATRCGPTLLRHTRPMVTARFVQQARFVEPARWILHRQRLTWRVNVKPARCTAPQNYCDPTVPPKTGNTCHPEPGRRRPEDPASQFESCVPIGPRKTRMPPPAKQAGGKTKSGGDMTRRPDS